MNTKQIFDGSEFLEIEKREYTERLDEIERKKQVIQYNCTHDIVFKYKDNNPRRILSDDNYYCPACDKNIICKIHDSFPQTVFRNSRVIPITNLSILGDRVTLKAIKKEAYSKMDYYYDKDIPIEELSSSMEKVIKSEEYDYNNEKSLKKTVK